MHKDNKIIRVRAKSQQGAILPPVLQVSQHQPSGSVIRAVVRHHLALTATSLGYHDRGGGKKTVLKLVSERERCKLSTASICVTRSCLMSFDVFFELACGFFIIIFMT